MATQIAVNVKVSTDEKDWKKKVTVTHDKPIPSDLATDEVLVRLKCRPINPSDVLAINGFYPGFRPTVDPATPGFEGMGYVEKVGSSVQAVKLGQRVVPLSGGGLVGDGTWQEYVKVKQNQLVPVPDGLEDEVAAQFFVNPFTVVGLLDDLNVPPGEFVIQTAAGSTLGQMLVSYAKHIGVKTINIVRGTHHFSHLKHLGADEVIDSESEDVLKRVMEITGGKLAYGAIDAVAGQMTKIVGQCVRDHGSVLVYGALSSGEGSYFVQDILFRYVQFKGFHLSIWIGQKYPEEAKRFELVQKVLKLLETGVMKPAVGPRFPLDQVVEAIEESLKTNKGKVLLVG